MEFGGPVTCEIMKAHIWVVIGNPQVNRVRREYYSIGSGMERFKYFKVYPFHTPMGHGGKINTAKMW